MTLQEFWDKLEAHDWFYHFSDDPKAFRAGSKAEVILASISNKSEDFSFLFESFRRHKFSGPSYTTERLPKPERPGGPRDIPKTDIPF